MDDEMTPGLVFSPESLYLENQEERRQRNSEGQIRTGIDFVDDCLGGFYPGDLVLLAAPTGHGKTAMAANLALAGAEAGKRVYFMPLEAYPGEVGDRLTYQEVAHAMKDPTLDYTQWYRRQRPLKAVTSKARDLVKQRLAKLQTGYKTDKEFNNVHLNAVLNELEPVSDMLVLDHVHIIDTDQKLSGQEETISTLEHFANQKQKVVVAVSHIRKKDKGEWFKVLPDRDDIHGSSELFKQSTVLIVMGKDARAQRPRPHLSPTYMRIIKSRIGRADEERTARMYFDESLGSFMPGYELGTLDKSTVGRGQAFYPYTEQELPSWAKKDTQRQKPATLLY